VKPTQRASKARRVIKSIGLLPAAFVIWRTVREWSPKLVVANARKRRQFKAILPIPPSNLIFSATGTRDVDWFLSSGEKTAESFRHALKSIHRPIESFEDVFEFGCGCGRVLRQWSQVEGPNFHASDYNPAGVEWARRHLSFVTLSTNELRPPLKYENASFDLSYAVSVFTHLPEELQEPWLAEMHRILRPDGILMVTLSGEGDLVRLGESEQQRFYNGELVVMDAKYAGTNMCGVYHPESYIRRHWSKYFDVLRFIPQGATGSPFQDLYVLRRVE